MKGLSRPAPEREGKRIAPGASAERLKEIAMAFPTKDSELLLRSIGAGAP
jgi:hypothetical protein